MWIERPLLLDGSPLFPGVKILCDDCYERWDREKRLKQQKAQSRAGVEKWQKICPDAFLNFDEGKLPRLDVWRSVLSSWTNKSTGIGISGFKGLGKTRMSWQLCKRAAAEGKEWFATRAVDFQEWATKLYVVDAHARVNFQMKLEKCKQVEILFLDDIDKPIWGGKFLADFYSMVDHRYQHNKRIVFTMNLKRGELEGTTDETGRAVISRLWEMCEVLRVPTLQRNSTNQQ